MKERFVAATVEARASVDSERMRKEQAAAQGSAWGAWVCDLVWRVMVVRSQGETNDKGAKHAPTEPCNPAYPNFLTSRDPKRQHTSLNTTPTSRGITTLDYEIVSFRVLAICTDSTTLTYSQVTYSYEFW